MKFNRIAVLLIAVMMVAIAAACSKSSDSNDSSASASPQSASPAASSAGAEATEQEAPPEPIEFTLLIDTTGPRNIVDFSDEVAKEITKRTGVSFKITSAIDDNQLPTLLAAGDYPDFVYTARMFNELSNPRVSLPWNELIASYAPDFALNPTSIATNTVDDGNFYTIKNNFGTKEDWADPAVLPNPGYAGLSVREDILNELGNPPLDTMEDFYGVLKAVKEKHPDMTPLLLGPPYAYGLTYFLEMFGSGGLVDYEENGQVYNQIRHPGTLEALLYINRLIREGLLPSESLIYEYEQYMDQLTSGKVFAVSHFTLIPSIVNASFAQSGSSAKMMVVEKPLSDKAVVLDSDIGWSGIYVTKSNKNPERAIKFLQFMFSEEGQRLSSWGIEGVHYVLDADGNPQFATPELEALKQDNDKFEQQTGINRWVFGSTLKTIASAPKISSEPDPHLDAWLRSFKDILVHRPEMFFVQGSAAPQGSPEAVIYSKVNSIVDTDRVKVLMAKTEEDARKAYDDIVAQAEAAGLEKLEAWQTQKYQSIKSRFE